MMSLSGPECVALIEAMRQTIEENRDRLSQLDATVGDGDHGINLATALTAAVDAVQQLDQPSPQTVMHTAGSTLINDMGGASGIIFGSFFRGGSRAFKNSPAVSPAAAVDFLRAGLAAVQKRGKAQPGDKTLVDALAPALAAAEEALQDDSSLPDMMHRAAAAAHAGASSTTAMVANVGRAKFLGERSLGHQDAGATSMALLLNAWADFLEHQ